MRSKGVLAAALGALLLTAAPAAATEQPAGARKNLKLVSSYPEAKYATAINFLQYGRAGHHRGFTGRGHGHGRTRDVMVATGRFGLIAYDLSDPAHPRKLDTLDNEALRLTGDPPTDFNDGPDSNTSPDSTYWQNEDMDVDQKRKLVFMARDPRSFAGTTGNPNSVSGVYIVDLRDPRDIKLITFTQVPTGHTTTCINDCQYLWTGGPASSTTQASAWPKGRPLFVTDIRDPRNPKTAPEPIDLFRDDGVTGYSHDVQVDSDGIAWVSGQGGTRGYWTRGRHYDPLKGMRREATAVDPVPYAGGEFENVDAPTAFMHNAERPTGRTLGDGPRPGKEKAGSLLLATEEADAEPDCEKQARFTIASLDGSYGGQAWRSTEAAPFRLRTVGWWSPHGQEGTLVNEDIYCSAHYFDVAKRYVAYSWYDQGTRILDVSDPTKPIQVAYYRPDGGVSWAPYFHRGYIYVADHERGVEVLRVTRGAARQAAKRRELVAPRPSQRHVRMVRASSANLAPDPQLGWLCPIPAN